MAQELDQAYMDSHPDWEKWHDEIPVSGGTRVGLMLLEKTPDLVPRQFYVNLPSKLSGKLCVEVSSRDGRYSAKAQYDQTKTSWAQFPFPTKFHTELKKYKGDEVVLLASVGGCDRSEKRKYLVSSWHKVTQSDSIAFYINSNLPCGIICEDINLKKVCNETPSPSVAYSKKCILNASDLSGIYNFQIMQREETMGEISMNYYNFPVIYRE
ncbi:hypothetical protein GCM10023115_40030 [Pontixanthobacter gangjinensis]